MPPAQGPSPSSKGSQSRGRWAQGRGGQPVPQKEGTLSPAPLPQRLGPRDRPRVLSLQAFAKDDLTASGDFLSRPWGN